LAEKFVSGRQSLLTNQSKMATATEKGLAALSSAMSTLQSKLLGMTGAGKTMAASSAVFSDTLLASAKAGENAAAGTYSFFVEQVASANKISYSGLSGFAGGGSLDIDVDGDSFNVDLSTQPTWTVRELAAAINGAADNSTVSAAVVTTGATAELVLTSKATGLASAIGVTANGVDAGLGAILTAPANQLAPAQDAILHVGSETGTAITQPSNTFSIIDGVTINVSKAQTTGSTPVTLTVASDPAATTANVQAFVDAYNELTKTVAGLTRPGNAADGVGAGAFAGDSGMRAMRDKLVSMLRVSSGGVSLANYGIIANRDGSLSLNSGRLAKTLATNPTGLDTLIGSSAAGIPTGIAGAVDTYLKEWTNASSGQIKSRKEAVTRLQTDLTTRQGMLDKQYDSAYARYLDQFSRLQSMQSKMTYNTSLFDSLFGGDSKS
jgi:flagellar hook-associated protein 2